MISMLPKRTKKYRRQVTLDKKPCRHFIQEKQQSARSDSLGTAKSERRTEPQPAGFGVEVPEELLRQCPSPDLDSVKTNGDLEQALGEAIVAIETCNDDKVRIKEWMDE